MPFSFPVKAKTDADMLISILNNAMPKGFGAYYAEIKRSSTGEIFPGVEIVSKMEFDLMDYQEQLKYNQRREAGVPGLAQKPITQKRRAPIYVFKMIGPYQIFDSNKNYIVQESPAGDRNLAMERGAYYRSTYCTNVKTIERPIIYVREYENCEVVTTEMMIKYAEKEQAAQDKTTIFQPPATKDNLADDM